MPMTTLGTEEQIAAAARLVSKTQREKDAAWARQAGAEADAKLAWWGVASTRQGTPEHTENAAKLAALERIARDATNVAFAADTAAKEAYAEFQHLKTGWRP